MPSLATGLLGAMTQYRAGTREGRDDAERRAQVEYERARQTRAEQRQTGLDAQQQTMMQAQLAQMRQAEAYRQASLQRQQEGDAREAYEGGYRPAPQAEQIGAAPVPDAAILSGVARDGRDTAQPAPAPAFTLNGTGMVKAGESLSEAKDRRALEQARAATADQRQWQVTHDTMRDKASEASQSRMFAQQDAAMTRREQAAAGRTGADTRSSTEGERRASGLLMVAEREQGVMDTLGTPNPKDRAAQAVPWGLGRVAMSDQARQYESSAQAFARAYLYTVSGANAPEAEVQGLAVQIMPMPLDGSDQTRAKTARRTQMLEAMREIGGRAAQPMQPMPSSPNGKNGIPERQPGETIAQYRARAGGR